MKKLLEIFIFVYFRYFFKKEGSVLIASKERAPIKVLIVIGSLRLGAQKNTSQIWRLG